LRGKNAILQTIKKVYCSNKQFHPQSDPLPLLVFIIIVMEVLYVSFHWCFT